MASKTLKQMPEPLYSRRKLVHFWTLGAPAAMRLSRAPLQPTPAPRRGTSDLLTSHQRELSAPAPGLTPDNDRGTRQALDTEPPGARRQNAKRAR